MTRRGKIILGTVFALVASVAAAFYAVLASEAGLNWLVARVTARVPGELTIATVRGELGGPIRLQDVAYRHEGLDIRVRAVDLDWNLWGAFAGVLRVNRLALDDLRIHTAPSSPDAAPVVLPEISLPLRLSVGELALNGMSVQAGADAAPVEIRTAAFSGAMFGSKVTIDRLEAVAPQGSVKVAGQLETAARYPMKLDVQWSVRAGEQDVRGRGTVGGDFARLELEQNVEQPVALHARLALLDALAALRWEASLDAKQFLPTALVADWPLQAADMTLQGQGSTTQAQGVLTLRSAHPATGKFELRADVAYEAMRVTINSLAARLLDIDTRVEARGAIALDASAPQSIGQMQFSGGWQQLRWPLAEAAVVSSRTGEFSLEGDPRKYGFQVRAPLVGEQIPQGDWTIVGNGDADRVTFTDVRIAALGGELRATGGVTWKPAVSWTLDVDAARINPGTQWPEWPGQLALTLHHEGRLENERVRGRVELRKADGKLRDYPLSVQLRAAFDGEAVKAERATLRSGDAMLSLRGDVDRDWNLDATLRAPKLAELWPELNGAASVDVRVRGPRAQPRVEVSLSGDRLKFGGTSIERAGGDAVLDWNTTAPSRLALKAERVVFGDMNIATLGITGDGTLSRHRVRAEADGEDGDADLEVTGALVEQLWNGELAQATIEHPRVGRWALDRPARLSASARHASIARGCWQRQNDALCLDAAWKADEFASANVELARLPTGFLKNYLPDTVGITGLLSGSARARYTFASERLDAEFSLGAGGGDITVIDVGEDSVRVEYRSVELQGRTGADGLNAAARFDFGALGRAEAQVQLKDWRPGADLSAQSLGGRVQAEVNDLGLVSRLTPALVDARGTLRADVTLGGTLASPALSGTAKLVDGAVAIPQIGIKLSGITMEAHNTPENVIKFSARGKSGPGSIELRGDFVPDKERGWPVLVEITGQNFEAVNLPEAWVLASPDLQLLVVRNRIDLNGVLAIPEARYAARDTSAAVTPSGDVIVVGKDKPPEREEKWQVYSAVRFVFGDKVTFNGFGLKGKVRGEVVAIEEPKKLTTGYGELQIVDASFNAYKIDLKVTRGRLTFAGGPINNPGIDARAVREAGTIREATAKDGKEEVREPTGIVVGALVRGTLRKLELTLFSEPPRDQADVLSLLLFGVPLGEATTEEGKALFLAASTLRLSGKDDTVRKIGRRFGIEEIRLETGNTPEQAALVLGRYLGPRLYVNYSVGLLSTTANVLRVRYRISDKWTLQSEQSDVESAADLLYTFEH